MQHDEGIAFSAPVLREMSREHSDFLPQGQSMTGGQKAESAEIHGVVRTLR